MDLINYNIATQNLVFVKFFLAFDFCQSSLC